MLLAFAAILSVCLSGCGNNSKPDEQEHTTLSFDERASYYDNLADAGEVESVAATEPGSLYRVVGSSVLVNGEVYNEIIHTFNRIYPDIYYKYGEEYYEPIVTLNFDPTYLRDDPANVVGNTINININWFNNNPDKVSVITYYIATTVMDYNPSAPEWIKAAVNYCIGAEFGAAGYELSGRYEGGSYEDDAATGANFLHWIKSKSGVDIVFRINRLLISNEWFEDDFWTSETGKSLERLWAEHKAS